MKIAFFSDIHANLPALETFFEDVEKCQPDFIYCLGDLVGYHIWANEVVDKIREKHIPTIMGNHEEALLHPSVDKTNLTNKELTREILSEKNSEYLTNLPREIAFSFTNKEEGFRFLLVHGSPKAIDDYLTEDYPEQSVVEMMRQADADVLLCGHTHRPYHRIIEVKTSGKVGYKHIINLGSVGKPKDGDPRICYALLDFDHTLSAKNSASLHVEFRRVAYDVEKAARAIEASVFPNSFAQALRLAE